MKIASAQVQMVGAHESRVRRETRRSLTNVQGTAQAPSAPLGGDDAEAVGLKNEDMKTAIMRQLLERMTGKKMDESEFERVMKELEAKRTEFRLSTPGGVTMPDRVAALRFESFERTEERETTAFSARAIITTENGREIEVGVDMVLAREFVEERRLELVVGQNGGPGGPGGPRGEQAKVKDPLVINFDAPAAALREDTTSFDLDSDGRADDIHFVSPGSGFVALDKNSNGSIDDGSELFGATTGDGFEELAAYDDDGNGWIDEGDAVFNRLEVWSKDAAGNDQRAGLAAHNVGAIYLGRVAAPHSYRNRVNASVAQMRTAGFYVGEIGHRAGSMQQLDLVV